MPATNAQQRQRLQRNAKKWTRTLMDAGWTVLPSVILEKQRALGLDPTDVNILLQLARYWWFSENPPHPSKATIAECMDVHPRTVQRHIAGLEAAGFIRRERRFNAKLGGQEANAYHFDGLIDEATPFAQEVIDTREERRKQDTARRKRKKPKVVEMKPRGRRARK